jgi:Cupin domain
MSFHLARAAFAISLRGSLERTNNGYAQQELLVVGLRPRITRKRVGRFRGERFPVRPGDSVSITPGVVHAIGNPGPGPLRFIVATSPAYNEADDIVVDEAS